MGVRRAAWTQAQFGPGSNSGLGPAWAQARFGRRSGLGRLGRLGPWPRVSLFGQMSLRLDAF